jgi:hypothetical protein
MPGSPGLTGIPAVGTVAPRGSRLVAVTEMMPLARYFLFVGGALMALLFVFDFFSPKAVADSGIQTAATVDKSALRIKSDQKWPERIVFDTTQPTIAPKAAPVQTAQAQTAPAMQAALPGPEPAAEITPKARVRETFAQFVPVEPKKADATVAKKRKSARGPGQPMRIARYGFFGTSTW